MILFTFLMHHLWENYNAKNMNQIDSDKPWSKQTNNYAILNFQFVNVRNTQRWVWEKRAEG